MLQEGFPLKICDLDVSIAVLHRDQYFYGRCLVILKWHEVELYKLSRDDRLAFFEDMIRVANALEKAFKPDKMNYAVLGNIVPHLHWHLIPRFKLDPLWGKPIWAEPHEEKKLSKAEYEELADIIRKYIKAN
ncbi:MAG: HIT family protein [Candidatus Methanomethylicota archaeon]|uniref:HIT family protein n=1 Tax=Thermoproteota archaeon TaxID=2056631 RepID=A0A497F3A7_9CREN|nr:MAG: HIT family protein [Candidatus Verstraetearchaeota archaeon]